MQTTLSFSPKASWRILKTIFNTLIFIIILYGAKTFFIILLISKGNMETLGQFCSAAYYAGVIFMIVCESFKVKTRTVVRMLTRLSGISFIAGIVCYKIAPFGFGEDMHTSFMIFSGCFTASFACAGFSIGVLGTIMVKVK